MNQRRFALKNLGLLAVAPMVAVPVQAAAAVPAASKPRRQRAPTFNPMSGNPLRTRSDVVAAMRDLYLPLTPYYSEGGARVRLDMAGAHFDRASADLEGYARPLWGLAPLAVGGGAGFVDWALLRRGLANGTDPQHPEFWGWCQDADQRLVELAAIGFALSLIPHLLWAPQSAAAKKNIAHYLHAAYGKHFVSSNWMWFRMMIGRGLQAVGETIDTALIAAYETKLDALYLDRGWYLDGDTRRADHYVGFALEFYGVVYSRIGGDPARAKVLRERADAFAPEFLRWFADDGGALAYGRSMTYRFACAGFWSALAFAGQQSLPWGQIKGLVLRHLRWWSKQPIAHRDGVLSIGYGYPNLHMCEPYNSAASPYWAFKIFAFMALPETHPFWTAQEEALPPANGVATQRHPGLILFNTPGNVIALASGQEENRRWMRMGPEKYCKFAYSSRYSFCVESDARQFGAGSFDNMLAFSSDGRHFSVREGNRIAKVADKLLYAQWSPVEGVVVDTWLMAAAPWHVRVHRIRADRAYQICEGGFAIERPDGGPGGPIEQAAGVASVFNATDVSGLRDLGSTVARTGRVMETQPNSNLTVAKASVPQLVGGIEAGETVLVTAVLAMPDAAAGKVQWGRVPQAPVLAELEAVIARDGVDVSTMKNKPA